VVLRLLFGNTHRKRGERKSQRLYVSRVRRGGGSRRGVALPQRKEPTETRVAGKGGGDQHRMQPDKEKKPSRLRARGGGGWERVPEVKRDISETAEKGKKERPVPGQHVSSAYTERKKEKKGEKGSCWHRSQWK